MNEPQLSLHDTDLGFTGNLARASLSADELAVRQSRSRRIGHAATGYPQPGGAIIYQRGDGEQALGNLTHVEQGSWHWTTLVAIVLLATLGVIAAMSDGGIGDDISQMLRKLS
jgi:hypothetical protein